MDQKTYIERFALWTAIIFAVVCLVLHVIFFKVIEANAFEEIAKRVVVSLGVLGIIIEPMVVFIIAPFCYHAFHEKKK